jgi:predicted RND superfamily exporter protein
VVRSNVNKSTEVGRTVATDYSGALVSAGLLEVDPQTGKRLNYFDVSSKLEEFRAKYSSDRHSVHIIGFAKAVGDIRDGTRGVLFFFLIAFVITVGLMYWFLKDWRLTLVSTCVALLPVLWLLGSLPLLGFGIDPLSILVPFLIFSIGVSHAVQMAPLVGARRGHRHGFPHGGAARVREALHPGNARAPHERARIRGDHADPHRHRSRARHHPPRSAWAG